MTPVIPVHTQMGHLYQN